MLTPEDMRKIIQGVIAGRLKPSGLPMNRQKLDALDEVVRKERERERKPRSYDE